MHMEPQERAVEVQAAEEALGGARRLRRIRRDLLCRAWLARDRLRHLAKRGVDVTVSGLALAALLPLFAVVALLIKATDRGPVLYWQERVGRHGRVFRFPKFRSMVTDSDAIREKLARLNQHGAEGVTFKMKNDPRITWIGRIIRRTSIDELPQLWCVLNGEMSLVGPRPALPKEVSRYSLADRRRLEATPGLTCHWQVQGRSEIPFPKQVELDVDYIESQNLALDIRLLAKTVPAVVTGKGAY
jgi:lipopolysaccharide/colanic/teichoic acid biosynthesis glycosyltransferase